MNADYTPGGSTGGEGATLYMKGSILGWGTDIGGSIRIPSHMMGLYGLRCSVRLRIRLFLSDTKRQLMRRRTRGYRIGDVLSQQMAKNIRRQPLVRSLALFPPSTMP